MKSINKNRQLVVINVVGLTHDMIGENTPNIRRLLETGFSRPMSTVLPAVTCSVQATLLTGLMPARHGIVANGWYFRDLAEVMFWKQSNQLIQGKGSLRLQSSVTQRIRPRRCSGGTTCTPMCSGR
jgi:predicted AlkP superfamily pyrophosphatase or phosphodiesterase